MHDFELQRPVGIDLGTTNSAVAMLQPAGEDFWLYEDRLRRTTVPSIVGWDPDDERFFIGWEAFNRRVMDPQPIRSVKRKMGQRSALELGPHELLPEEVSAKVLGALVEQMRGYLADKPTPLPIQMRQAVITVPAYFDAPQIEATRRAGEIAGLEVLSLVQEPTAAAMYYAWKHSLSDGTFLVYDLGGGTFDVSVIRSIMGEYQVLAIEGDNYLGGDDFDRRLAEFLRQHLAEQGYRVDFDLADDADDRRRFDLLMRVAREIKEALTSSQVQYVGRRDLFEDQSGEPVTLDLEISREHFESLIADLVDETIEACHRALTHAAIEAEVGLEAVDHVLLVGGSTRVPLVQRRVAEVFCGDGGAGCDHPLIDEPDTCVALGAAIQAANLAGVTVVDTQAAQPPLRITSPLGTRDETTRLVGQVLALPAADVRTAALIVEGEVAGVARLEAADDRLDFVIDAITLDRPGRHECRLELCNPDGDPMLAWPVTLERLAQEAPYRPTGGALSNPTVLAKDIYLEVAGDGQPERELLVARGTSLPTRQSFTFYTADSSGAVLLRLYQNRYPIRTIHLEVPDDLEVGTPVELTLAVDETMQMTAEGDIAGQTFWAQIEPPPLAEARDWEAIEALLDQVDQTEQVLWGMEARAFSKRVRPLVTGIRETARTDPDKLQVLVRRLEGVLEDYHNQRAQLTPGWSRFVAILNAIKRTVYRGDRDRPLGRDLSEWRDRLTALEAQAHQAYQGRDQDVWTEVFDQAQATWESLAQDEHRFASQDPAEAARRFYANLQRAAEKLERGLDDFVLSSHPEARQLQSEELDRMRRDLRERVREPLRELALDDDDLRQQRRELGRIGEAIKRLNRRLDELPNRGLVRR